MSMIFYGIVILLASVCHLHYANASLVQFSESRISNLEDPTQAPVQWGFSTSASDLTVTVYQETNFGYIAGVSFNSGNKWANDRPLEIEFWTGPSQQNLLSDIKCTITVHSVISNDGQKKYIRAGHIYESSNTFQPSHLYRLKFLPPSTFAQPGEYIVVISFHRSSNIMRYRSIMVVSKSVLMQQAAQPLHVSTSPESALNDFSERNRQMNHMPAEIINKILNRMNSPAEVCIFCSQSKSVMAECDAVFSRFRLPQDQPNLPRSVPSTVQHEVDFGTAKLCKIGYIDRLLQQLEFRYELDRTKVTNGDHLKTPTIKNFRDALIEESGGVPEHFSVWTAISEQDSFKRSFIHRYRDVIRKMHKFFESEWDMPKRNSDISLDDLKSMLLKFKEHPKSEMVEYSIAKRLSVIVGDDHVLFNFHPRANPADAISIIMNRDSVADQDVERWSKKQSLNTILNYWKIF
ncbi:hypothetical protein BKA69DRAFT_1170130 [Paraphysoderma sedebokerense]|nr:hypothetical protein BKA69DRAFT_1170130 [Paraphysoderma sedebokerense]